MRHAKAAHWNAKYLAGIPGWDRQASSPALMNWLESELLTPCSVLIPGCGRGHEALELARRGFDVTALDIAPAPLEHLEKELAQAGLSAELIQDDVHTWQPAKQFDAIYEQTCICALPPEEWPAYETQLHRWLVPGGRIFALFMQTEAEGGPPFHCALPEMHALFPPSRWHWPSHEAVRIDHFGGKYELATILEKAP